MRNGMPFFRHGGGGIFATYELVQEQEVAPADIEELNVKYGMNYFPEKIYKGEKYPEGEYESMVIEIGEHSGDNYWCVLFPPLCMIDAEESEEAEYSFFISEMIKKFFK